MTAGMMSEGTSNQIDIVQGYDALHLFLNRFLAADEDQGLLRTLAVSTDRPHDLNSQPTDLALWNIWTECVAEVVAKRDDGATV